MELPWNGVKTNTNHLKICNYVYLHTHDVIHTHLHNKVKCPLKSDTNFCSLLMGGGNKLCWLSYLKISTVMRPQQCATKHDRWCSQSIRSWMNIDDFITPGISLIIYHFRGSTEAQQITLWTSNYRRKRQCLTVSGSSFRSRCS